MAVAGTDISAAATLLKAGRLVAIPTETVYGLAANALDADAVVKIFKAKNRPYFNPLIVHCGSLQQAESFTAEFPPIARQLAQRFWPGPLTLILKKHNSIPDIVTAGHAFVGLRVPRHALTLQLLSSLPFPLAAPSANPFGYVSPTTAQHVAQQLDKEIDYILDGGPCAVGVESTIISFAGEHPVLLRHGGIAQEQVEEITGPLQQHLHNTTAPHAPGQLAAHYSPGKKLLLGNLDELLRTHQQEKVAVLSLQKKFSEVSAAHQVQLSTAGNLDEAAQQIFAALRQLDEMPVDLILAEWMPDTGLGRAINDRLKRAAAK